MTATPAMSRRYATLLASALSVIALTCVALWVPVPYVTMKPGPAFNTLGEFDGKPMFSFGPGVKTYPTSGTLDFTTVSVTRANTRMTLAEAVRSYFDKNVAVVPKSLIYPNHQSAKASTTESAAQLAGSKDTSRAAALTAAGYPVISRPTVRSVLDSGAAAGKLVAGDIIAAVDGSSTDSPEAVVKAIAAHRPGDTVTVTVRRDGDRKDISIVTEPDGEDPTVPRVGISLGATYDYPIEITNNVGSEIGGPSAGAMFALAIYDKLTPGELTGGKRIAGTGEITGEGQIQPIGGVRQKMAGAARDKASIFLVPAANCAEATSGGDFGLKLVKITTLKSAITALDQLRENPRAKVPTCN